MEKIEKVYFVGNVAKTCLSIMIQIHLSADTAITVNMAFFSTLLQNYFQSA